MNCIPRRRFCALTLAAVSPLSVQAARASTPIPVAHSEALDAVFVSAVLNLIGEASGLSFDPHAVSFARVLRMAEQGEAIGFGISPTAARREQLTFSRALFTGAVWAVSRRDAGIDARDVETLRGKVMCQSRQASYDAETADLAQIGMDAQQISGDLAHRVRALVGGHCDVLLVTSRNASVEALRVRLRSVDADMAALRLPHRPLLEEKVHLGVARNSPLAAPLLRVDAAIQARRRALQRLVSQLD